MNPVVATFLETAHRSPTIDVLTSKFGNALNQVGFTHWAFQLVAPAHDTVTRPRIIANYPDFWVERYIERGYHRIDPVITDGAKQVTPFTWDAIAKPHRDNPAVRTFFLEATEAGLPTGFGLAIHGGNQAKSLISASSSQSPAELERSLVLNGRDLHLASLVFNHVARDLLAMNALNAKPVSLTPREQECLLWALQGKSAWDIATILNVSEPAVRFHFANIREKLDVTTIREAVVKAYMLGLIHP